MSVNRNENKIYNCQRVRKSDPKTVLEEFEIKALSPGKARVKLDKRFFLEEGETWVITRILNKELAEKEPWKMYQDSRRPDED